MSEEWDGGNEDAWVLGSFIIILYLVGTAIWVFGWAAVLGVAAAVVGIPLGIVLYLRSETHRYRQAQREIRQLTKWAKRQMRKL